MKKASQKAKDAVCSYLHIFGVYTYEKGKPKSEITSTLLKENPRGFQEGIYGLAVDNLDSEGKLEKRWYEKTDTFGTPPREDLPKGFSGLIYWFKEEKKKE